MPFYFNGKRLISPQAASTIDTNSMANSNPIQPAGTVAIIGANNAPNSGGVPFTPLVFTDASQAQRVLIDGDLLEAVKRALSPGPGVGAGRVIAVRANSATQSTGILKDTNGGGSNAVNITSKDYGQRTQSITVTTSTPSPGGTPGLNFNVTLGSSQITGNAVGNRALEVQYTGTGTSPTMAVTYTGSPLVGTLTTTIATTTADSKTLSFATYQTLEQLASALNATGVYIATVVHPGHAQGEVLSTVLDAQTAISIPVVVSPTLPGTLRADVDAQVAWLNVNAGGLLTATRVGGTRALSVQSVALQGGGNGNAVPSGSEWDSCLSALQNTDAHIIVPLSSSTNVHRAVQAHVQFMSDVAQGYGRRERIAIVGGDAGELYSSTVNAATRAAALQDSRMVVVGPGIKDVDAAGNTVVVPPYMLAAQVAGLIAGMPVGQSITRAYISAVGLEAASATTGSTMTQVERDNWLLAGVCVLEQAPNRGVRVVQGRTSWSVTDEYVLKEIVTRRCADWTARSVREACDDLLVGQAASPALAARAVVTTSSILRDLAANNILVGDGTNPPFKNIVASVQGEVLRIDFQASPVIPANYIAITAHMLPYSGVAISA